MEIDFTVLTLLGGVIAPFVTAVSAKLQTKDWEKGFITITFSAIIAALQGFIDGKLGLGGLFSQFLTVWLTALVSWLGLTSDWVKTVHESTPGFFKVSQ